MFIFRVCDCKVIYVCNLMRADQHGAEDKLPLLCNSQQKQANWVDNWPETVPCKANSDKRTVQLTQCDNAVLVLCGLWSQARSTSLHAFRPVGISRSVCPDPPAIASLHASCLLLSQGVGERSAARDIPKIAILNGSHDRETSRCSAAAGPMSAADVVLALQHSLNRRGTDSELTFSGDAYVTAMLVPAGGDIHVDKHRLLTLGVR